MQGNMYKIQNKNCMENCLTSGGSATATDSAVSIADKTALAVLTLFLLQFEGRNFVTPNNTLLVPLLSGQWNFQPSEDQLWQQEICSTTVFLVSFWAAIHRKGRLYCISPSKTFCNALIPIQTKSLVWFGFNRKVLTNSGCC